jgi:aldehyde:ferredoxin oxidoreductase
MKTHGYMGQLLKVDLSSKKISTEGIDKETLRAFIGARGLGIRLLEQIAPPGVDPFAPENPLILATGPYTGTGVFSAFFNVTTKSPLTGISTGSHCGGWWGPQLKRAGFDAIVITGASERPCYLVVDEGKASLEDGGDLWTRGAYETERVVKERHGGAEVLSIGPAGENLVRFAAMMNRHRAAGRSGVGAVMGSKKLKAIAVRGRIPIETADDASVKAISRQGGKNALEAGKAFAKYGTSMVFGFFNEKHTLPTRNFREGHFKEAAQIGAETLKTKYFVKDQGCFNCPLKCGNLHRVTEGPYKLDEVEGPEYETLMAFGSNCGNTNVESILMANHLCNDLGMDTISCGDVFALLMDLFDLGIIGKEQLDGYSMKWGEHESVVALIPKIARREGVGDLLAEGSYVAASKWGPKALNRAILSKRQEFPGYEFRRSFGTGFSLITSNRGADHLRATFYVNEIFMGQFEQDGFESHMETLLDKEHQMIMADSFCVCKFGMRNAQYTWPVLTELYNALTGFGISEEELKRAGERVWNLERLYNLREGLEEDMPPSRFFEEDLTDGFEGGKRITKERFLEARSMYYAARGWNDKGEPLPEKLRELGLQS